MSLDWDNIENMTYVCLRCGRLIKGEELITLNQIKCPECGFRVLRKVSPPVVKRVRAI